MNAHISNIIAGLETNRFHKQLVQIQDLHCAWSSVESSSNENEVGESKGLGHTIICLTLKIIYRDGYIYIDTHTVRA